MPDSSQNEYFSTKLALILSIISIIILVLGTVLVLFSGKFIDTAYDFFAHHVFHREFKLEKWLPTIEALFSFPIFAVVFVNAVLFPKYSLRTKIVLLSSILVAVGFSIVYSTAVATNANINSDLAAEFILAKECVLEHSFLPTGWYYGTEIRMLNTELISAPIFLFANNWLLNKRAVLSHYGFQENVSVMTPSGFINLMVIAGLLLLVYMVSVVLRDKEIPYTHRLVLVFAAISFGLNTFVYYFVEFYSRYYYSVLVFIFPVIAIIMQNKKNSKGSEISALCLFRTAFTASAFITVEHFINLNSNKKREGYIEFLNNSDYTHGYAIFADANVTVFLTNGRVTVENLDNDAAEDGTFVLKKEYSYKKWLTPARYYTDIYEGNVFLLLSKQTYENCRDYELIRNGIVVYEDSAYIIFDYESAQKFKESF